MRPVPRPGLRLLRRDARTLRAGLEWPGAAVLLDTPAVRAVLASLDGMRDVADVLDQAARRHPQPAACRQAFESLVQAGIVVDATADTAPADVPARVRAAWWLQAGPDRSLRDELRRRASAPVAVRGDGDLARTVQEALDELHVPLVPEAAATLVVIASDHEPFRILAEDLLAQRRDHVWVHLRDLVGVVGPWVRPGTTPCLSCVDAATANVDPTWPTVVDAYLAPSAAGTAVDPTLVRVVGAWAASLIARGGPTRPGEVVELSFVHGTRSTTYDLHPTCGCAWPAWDDTLGA